MPAGSRQIVCGGGNHDPRLAALAPEPEWPAIGGARLERDQVAAPGVVEGRLQVAAGCDANRAPCRLDRWDLNGDTGTLRLPVLRLCLDGLRRRRNRTRAGSGAERAREQQRDPGHRRACQKGSHISLSRARFAGPGRRTWAGSAKRTRWEEADGTARALPRSATTSSHRCSNSRATIVQE